MMKRFFLITVLSLSFAGFRYVHSEEPKLVVLVSLDQFPYEYLTRFEPYFSKNGFQFLLRNGANFTNAQYEHAYTKTAPSHAALITGVYGHINGITANKWYDRTRKKEVNSVDDDSVKLLGINGEGCSPRNLEVYTVGDMLRRKTHLRSKVIGISNKDRSAILMAGKLGTAFWFVDSIVTTSTYYMPDAPSWLKMFNTSGAFQRYFGKQWTETDPKTASIVCNDDDTSYKASSLGLGKTFPHPLVGKNPRAITPSFYQAIEHTPFATTLLLEVCRKAVIEESLGVRGTTDMLCVGVSAIDEIGHSYGPQSREVFDDAVRTDRMLGEFFHFLDKRLGLRHCVIILTSDHGIAPVPEYQKKKHPGVEAGRVSSSQVLKLSEQALESVFGKPPAEKKWVAQVLETDIYLDAGVLNEKNISLNQAIQVVKDSISSQPFVAAAYTQKDFEHIDSSDHSGMRLGKTFYPQRMGDIMLILKPYFIVSSDSTGTNHGQPYEYDSHVPLIFYGKEFISGVYRERVSPIDLAPTLAEILKTPPLPFCEGHVLREAVKE